MDQVSDAPPLDVKVVANASRCPFCHEFVAFERVKWVACAGCLARHHASCWTESHACGTCGDPRALALVEPERRRSSALPVLAGSLLLVLAQGAAVFWLTTRLDRGVEAARKQKDDLQAAVDENVAAVKKLAKRVPGEQTDRTDEVLEKLDGFERASDAKRRQERLEHRLDMLDVQVASARMAPVVVAGDRLSGKGAAIEALSKAKSDGTLSSSEFEGAKRAVLDGKVGLDTVTDVVRLAALERAGVLSSSELRRAKSELLQPR